MKTMVKALGFALEDMLKIRATTHLDLEWIACIPSTPDSFEALAVFPEGQVENTGFWLIDIHYPARPGFILNFFGEEFSVHLTHLADEADGVTVNMYLHDELVATPMLDKSLPNLRENQSIEEIKRFALVKKEI